jgi:predicted lipoprotein with Yx(FWY)xxD motif
MPRPADFRPSRRNLRAAALAILALALVATGATAIGAQHRSGSTSKRVARAAQNETLGKTVLTTIGGRTLYSLSAETKGRFICTGSCLAAWHPLLVPAGVRPTGPVKLGTIARPEGKRVQVTYRGRPLYRFDGDAKAGEVNGEGINDVGTWHAASVPEDKPSPGSGESPPAPQPPPPYNPPYGGY